MSVKNCCVLSIKYIKKAVLLGFTLFIYLIFVIYLLVA